MTTVDTNAEIRALFNDRHHKIGKLRAAVQYRARRSVDCPYCGVKAGKRCVTFAGDVTIPHNDRIKVWLREERTKQCST